jgi:hypothetical protein
MQPKPKTLSWSRLAALVWASLWMLAVPLFHVHPEAQHRHGEIGHVHGSIVHTVFSSDPDGEYDDHHATDGIGHGTPSHDSSFIHLAHADGVAELPFIFFIESTDPKPLKPIGPLLFLSEAIAGLIPAPPVLSTDRSENTPRHRFVAHAIPTRAPPSPFV